MTDNPVFRKVSLDRLASPEQLDQLLEVTDARGWIALGAVALCLVTAMVWGVTGEIPESVRGQGILVRTGGVYEIVPTTGGRVIDVAAVVGDTVREGQVVARLAQPELAERLQQARATRENLREQHAQLVAFSARDVELQRSLAAQQRANLEQSIASQQEALKSLREKVATQEQLVQQGLLTRPTLLSSRQQLDAATDKLANDQSQRTQLEVKALALKNDKEGSERSSSIRLADQERQVTDLERELKAKTEVITPYTGRVLEVMADRGSVVGTGSPVLTLDLTGRAVKDLEAVIYVASATGKQLRPGMAVQIAPSTVKQEEYGLMLGKVTYVSDFPATSMGMSRVLKNERLVSELSGGGAPYEVHADLIVDPTTVSRYRWSSSGGPPLRIQSGTLAGANIAVASRRPVEMVIPLLRKYVGL